MPFTVDQFLEMFTIYNAAIWPAQLVSYVLGLLAVGALWWDRQRGTRVILIVLAVFWAFNGMAYHLSFFSRINPPAIVFGLLFLLQAALFAVVALTSGHIQFRLRADGTSTVGLALIAYALLVYEALGYFAGHGLMNGPLFGVAPCPTTIFTIGMLMLAEGKMVPWLSIIPIAWSIIGASAAVLLGVPEDLGLVVAGLVLALQLTQRGSAASRQLDMGLVPKGARLLVIRRWTEFPMPVLLVGLIAIIVLFATEALMR